MSVFVVTWNLNKEGAAYNVARTRFFQQLGQYNYKTNAGLETVAWVSTTSTATQVDTYLRQALDTDDSLFVSKLNRGEYQGWLRPTTWDWINQHV